MLLNKNNVFNVKRVLVGFYFVKRNSVKNAVNVQKDNVLIAKGIDPSFCFVIQDHARTYATVVVIAE